ncbi:MAG: response regulator transcription factor [Chloroflexi bacterium]|nr:response regulator transcription factor [Chloroflexota bacterium]MBP8057798.1 response regulator transcription factor [Chloroflexota bacterium]
MFVRMCQLWHASPVAKWLAQYGAKAPTRYARMPDPPKRLRVPIRVLILDNEMILSAGIEQLLRNAAAIEVHGLQSDSQNRILETIHQLKPDTVILNRQSTLTNALELLYLFRGDYPEQIIEVNPQSEQVQVYERHWLTIRHISELTIIIGSYQP